MISKINYKPVKALATSFIRKLCCIYRDSLNLYTLYKFSFIITVKSLKNLSVLT